MLTLIHFACNEIRGIYLLALTAAAAAAVVVAAVFASHFQTKKLFD